jgi:hypothetical protein
MKLVLKKKALSEEVVPNIGDRDTFILQLLGHIRLFYNCAAFHVHTQAYGYFNGLFMLSDFEFWQYRMYG